MSQQRPKLASDSMCIQCSVTCGTSSSRCMHRCFAGLLPKAHWWLFWGCPHILQDYSAVRLFACTNLHVIQQVHELGILGRFFHIVSTTAHGLEPDFQGVRGLFQGSLLHKVEVVCPFRVILWSLRAVVVQNSTVVHQVGLVVLGEQLGASFDSIWKE